MKKCCTCKQEKPLSDFYNNKASPDGKQTFCKSCGQKRIKAYRQTPQAQAANRARWKHRSLPEKLAIFKRNPLNRRGIEPDPNLTTDNLLKKFGSQPKCYLTGQPIDLNDWESYSLDHIIPVSKGGLSNLENCGLTCRDANYAKYNLTETQFVQLCQRVLDWQKTKAHL